VRTELEGALSAARTLAPDELPHLLGELEEIRATALARLTAPPAQRSADSLLSVKQAAERLHVSEDYLYTHHARLPFTVRMGRKLLFSSVGLDQYLRRRR
jgi:excisionase family DNA binding protein